MIRGRRGEESDTAFFISFFFFEIHVLLFIYLWLCWVFVSVRGLSPVAASGGHSSSQCAGLSLSRPLLLRSTGSRRAGSVIVAHGPSCSVACGIFPDQESNPCPLHWQADSQPLRHQGSPSSFLYLPWWLLSLQSHCYRPGQRHRQLLFWQISSTFFVFIFARSRLRIRHISLHMVFLNTCHHTLLVCHLLFARSQLDLSVFHSPSKTKIFTFSELFPTSLHFSICVKSHMTLLLCIEFHSSSMRWLPHLYLQPISYLSSRLVYQICLWNFHIGAPKASHT